MAAISYLLYPGFTPLFSVFQANQSNSGSQSSSGQPSQVSPMMTNWGSSATSSSPWGSAAGAEQTQQQAQQQQQQQVQQQWSGYGVMHPPPPVSSQHQFNQFSFGSNSYDSFRSQRSLPSPNMNHHSQFLGLNGNPTSSGSYKGLFFTFFYFCDFW